jgi:hypothetical protein
MELCIETDFEDMLYTQDEESITPLGVIRRKITGFERVEWKGKSLAIHKKKIDIILYKKRIYMYTQRQGKVIVKCMCMKRMVSMINVKAGGPWRKRGPPGDCHLDCGGGGGGTHRRARGMRRVAVSVAGKPPGFTLTSSLP